MNFFLFYILVKLVVNTDMFSLSLRVSNKLLVLNKAPKQYHTTSFLSMVDNGQDSSKLPKKYTKSNLPVKICEQCNRPMEWRKSWAKNWDEVKYCSDKCRKLKKKNPLLNPKSSSSSSTLVSNSIPNIIGRGGNANKPKSRSFILIGAAMLSSALSSSKRAAAANYQHRS